MTELPAQRSHSAVVKTHTGLHILWAIRENINNNDNDNKGKPGEERSWYLRFFFPRVQACLFLNNHQLHCRQIEKWINR